MCMDTDGLCCRYPALASLAATGRLEQANILRKEIALQAEGNTEQIVTAWLQENNISINPASKYKLQVKLVKRIAGSKTERKRSL